MGTEQPNVVQGTAGDEAPDPAEDASGDAPGKPGRGGGRPGPPPPPDPARQDGGPPVRRVARHVTAASDDFIGMCEEALSATGLHYVAEYHRGVFNYSVDMLDAAAAHVRLPGGDSDTTRDLYSRMGRQLNFLLDRLDQSLRPVESGRLIRTVMGLEEGTLYHFFIRSGEYLTGVSLGPEHADAGDRAMAAVVARLRSALHQVPIDHGGFLAAAREEAAPPGPRPTGAAHPAGQDALQVHVSAGVAGRDQLIELCAEAVRAEDLHYVAYVDPSFHTVTADLLGHASLRPFFKNITEDERRERYERIGRRLNFTVGRLNHSLTAVLSGRLTRAVLDVEEGAIYYYALGRTDFLLGVTLDQDRVTHADERVSELARRIEAVTR